MKLRRRIPLTWPLWFLAAAIAPTGCDRGSDSHPAATSPTAPGAAGPSAPRTGGVAVIDLERVGKELNWNDQLQRDARAAEATLRQQLDERVKTMARAVEEKKKLVAASAKLTRQETERLNAVKNLSDLAALPLSEEQRNDLVSVLAAAEQDVNAARNEYQAAVRQQQAALVNTYRNLVRPVAKRVAADSGLSVVLTPADHVLYYDAAVDITDKVIEELRKSPAPATSQTDSAETPPGG
jgi:Skp family chaperone for outer membrane proteins